MGGHLGYGHLGYAGHLGYYGHGLGYYRYGKRSADAEADPYLLYRGHLGYAGHLGYYGGLGHYDMDTADTSTANRLHQDISVNHRLNLGQKWIIISLKFPSPVLQFQCYHN